MCQSDRDIVENCLNGRPEAFRHLVRRYEGPLVSHLTGRLGDREQAEETAQETFVRAYFALGKLRKPDSFFAWIVGIGDRVVLEQQRAQRRQREIAVEAAQRSEQETHNFDLPLQETIARLPDIYREAIQLRYFGELSCSEVAERLSVPLGTVTKRLSRAYALLRNALSGEQARQQNSEVQS